MDDRCRSDVGAPGYRRQYFPYCLKAREKSVTMALDARTRSSILDSLVPVIGEHNANALMSEFPSVEADELVTKQFLRAELAELESRLLLRLGAALAGSLTLQMAVLGTLIALF